MENLEVFLNVKPNEEGEDKVIFYYIFLIFYFNFSFMNSVNSA